MWSSVNSFHKTTLLPPQNHIWLLFLRTWVILTAAVFGVATQHWRAHSRWRGNWCQTLLDSHHTVQVLRCDKLLIIYFKSRGEVWYNLEMVVLFPGQTELIMQAVKLFDTTWPDSAFLEADMPFLSGSHWTRSGVCWNLSLEPSEGQQLHTQKLGLQLPISGHCFWHSCWMLIRSVFSSYGLVATQHWKQSLSRCECRHRK